MIEPYVMMSMILTATSIDTDPLPGPPWLNNAEQALDQAHKMLDWGSYALVLSWLAERISCFIDENLIDGEPERIAILRRFAIYCDTFADVSMVSSEERSPLRVISTARKRTAGFVSFPASPKVRGF